MSSKGQVVIPLDVRKELDLKEGAPLAVIARKDSILLKKIETPKTINWEEATRPFREAARKSRFTSKDLERLISNARKAQ